jgi:sugar phosphate permease
MFTKPHETKSPSKIFYGWWIVAACFVCAMSSGVVGYSFTAFFDSFVQEFGWSYAVISMAASLRGAETGLISPISGFLVDRWGSRWILFAGIIITGLGLIFLSLISTLVHYYIAFFVIAIGTSCCGPTVVNPVINHWFRRNLGKATGMLIAGFAASGLLVPIIYKLIESYGWREALILTGIASTVICIPLTFIVKQKPEPYGYMPDGDNGLTIQKESNNKNVKVKDFPIEEDTGVSRALKSQTFWYFTMAYTLQSLVLLAVISHIMPYLNTVNISSSTASFFAGAIPILSIVGRLVAGWLGDSFSIKRVTLVSFTLLFVGTLLFDYVNDLTFWILILAIILFSIGYGSSLTLRTLLLREYFGRSRFATIFGLLIGIQSLGAMLGPVIAGWTYDIWESYHYAWIILTGLSAISLILLAITPKIRTKETFMVR